MKIILKGTDLLIDSQLGEYIEKKFLSLKKFLVSVERKRQLILNVEVARTTKHHNKGEKIYYVECTIELLGKTIRIEQYSSDVKKAIDMARNRLKREFVSEIEKRRE